jgi:N-acetyl sugar amidotransferase
MPTELSQELTRARRGPTHVPTPEPGRTCLRCVMDTSAQEIRFDGTGFCNFCTDYLGNAERHASRRGVADDKLCDLVAQMKRAGRRREYDCVLGVSGGVDSSYLAYKTKELGLRVLAVHFDNGWNSELAVRNVESLVKKLEIDYQTYVVDWDEFRRLQLSFLRASIPNAEIPTDHGITATLYKTCADTNVRFLLTGSNLATEGILPSSWAYNPKDLRHLKTIHRQFGDGKFSSFPRLGYPREVYYAYLKRIRRLRLLNFMPYVKSDAMKTLKAELGWIYYGGKHYESVFTRFFQAYILPRKFGIDKRRAHLSTLICSGQITRDEALIELDRDLYDPDQLRLDKEYVCKKLGLDQDEFEHIMNERPRTSRDYSNSDRSLAVLYGLYNRVRR